MASIGGIFIPAHIDKPQNSVISQLGISARCDLEGLLARNAYLKKRAPAFIRSSDAHYPEDFCRAVTYFNMPCRSFGEIRMALHGENGRSVKIDLGNE